MTHESGGQIYALKSKVFYKGSGGLTNVADFDAKMREKACIWAMNRQTPTTLTQDTDLAVAYPLTAEVAFTLNGIGVGSNNDFASGQDCSDNFDAECGDYADSWDPSTSYTYELKWSDDSGANYKRLAATSGAHPFEFDPGTRELKIKTDQSDTSLDPSLKLLNKAYFKLIATKTSDNTSVSSKFTLDWTYCPKHINFDTTDPKV